METGKAYTIGIVAGLNKDGFHYLGVSYSSTQPENNAKVIYANDARYLDNMGGGKTAIHERQNAVEICITPHPRTLRNARIQVQQMVIIGFSTKHIRRYLHQFLLWWAKTIDSWSYQELITWFVEACRDICPAAHARAYCKATSAN